MTPDNIQGLPAHPLLVHGPVVLIPLVGLAALAMIVRPSLRQSLGWITVGLSFVAVVLVQMAIESGQSLERRVPSTELIEAHEALTGAMRPLSIALFVLLLIFVLLDRRVRQTEAGDEKRDSRMRAVSIFVSVALAVTVVGTTYRLVEVGHSGAKAIWDDIPESR